MNMENRMVGMNPLPAVLAVAANELKASRFFPRLVNKTDREVLGKILALPKKGAEQMIAVCRLQRHVVASHPSFQAHLVARRVEHLLRARD
jgi:hypothetical protein